MTKLINGVVAALVLVTIASAQTDPVTPSSIQVRDLTISSLSFNALMTLAERYHVVIGIYGIFSGTESQAINISLKDGTLGEVFDAIVKADPRLEWKATNSGAVHFIFRNAPLSLVDITVHTFDSENPRRIGASGSLRQIPEVDGWLRDHRCIMSEVISGRAPKEWGNFVVHARDASFGALLDEIAAKSGTYFWSAIQLRADPCAIDLRP